MIGLDPRSVAYAAAVAGTILLVLLIVYWRVRKTYPGFGHWVVSLAMLVMALSAISWARYTPGWLSEMAINAASILAMLFAASGAHLFLRNSPLDRMTVVLTCVCLAAVFVVQFTGPSVVRAGLGGAVMGVVALWAAFVFFHPRVPGMRMGTGLCALLLMSMAVERFWRAGFFVSESLGWPTMDPHLAALINHSFNASFIPLWTVACLFVNASRIELDLRNSRAEILEQARRDPLTGLPNRRAFLERCDLEQVRLDRHAAPLSLILIDLDGFKRVNDRFGHPAGDQVLVELARILEGTMRHLDEVARLGGEEFAILLTETPLDDAALAAERLRERIAAELVVDAAESEGGEAVTASMGVGEYTSEDGGFDQFLARVDVALYEAKGAGRNRVRISPGPKAADQRNRASG